VCGRNQGIFRVNLGIDSLGRHHKQTFVSRDLTGLKRFDMKASSL